MKNFRKLFLAVVFIAMSGMSWGQAPGPNCLSAVWIPGAGASTTFVQASPNGWLQFVALEANKKLLVVNEGGPSDFKIKKITVATGTCNSLTPLETDTISGPGDDTLMIDMIGMTVGNTYFIRTVMQTSTDCPSCTSGSAAFHTNLEIMTPGGCDVSWYFNGVFQDHCYGITKAPETYNPVTVCLSTQFTISYSGASGPLTTFDIHVFPQAGGQINYFNENSSFPLPLTLGVCTVAVSPPGMADDPSSPIFGQGNNYGCCEIVLTVVPDPTAAFTIGPACTNSPICFTGTSNNPIYDQSNYYVYNASNVLVASGVGTNYCASITTPGTYSVFHEVYASVAGSNFPVECFDSLTQFFTVSPPPGPVTITASPTTTVCSGSNAIINLSASSSGAILYQWAPATGLNNASIYNPVLTNPTVTTTYTVTATNAAGCTNSQTITITVQNCCLNPQASTYPSMVLNNVTFVPIGTAGAFSYMNFVFGGTYAGLVESPPGGLPIGAYTVLGNLTINDPTQTFTFNGCDIIFSDCSTLYQLTPLSIDKSYLHACNMWQGISSRNYLKVTNSIIEDAWDGVIIGLISSHPGLLVDNCVFNKNKYGIVLAGATNFNTASPNNFKITGTIFTCRNISPTISYNVPLNYNFTSILIGHNNTVKGSVTTMKGGSCTLTAVRSEAGIYMLSSTVSSGNFFNIGNTSGGTNYFSYLNEGIYNTGSKIYVVNSDFQDITLSGGPALAGIVHDGGLPNTVTNVGDLNSSVKSCMFQNSEMGIKAFKGGNMNICSNNFNTGLLVASITTGIDVENWGDPNGTVNILQNNFTRCSTTDLQALTNNSIKLIMQGNTSTGSGKYNVNIQETGSPNALYRIDGNNFSDRQSGIYLNGVINGNITDNTINIANNASSGSVFTSGIWNYNCKSCLFSGNTISSTNPNTNNSKYYVFGIFTEAGNGNTYCSNTISHVGESMKVQFNCIPSNIYSNNFNTSGPPSINAILLGVSAQTGPLGVLSGTTWYSADNLFGTYSSQQLFNAGGLANFNYYYNASAPTSGGTNPYVLVSTGSIPGGPVCPSATFRLRGDSLQHHPSVFDPSSKDYLKEEYYIARMFEQYNHILPDSVMNTCAASNIGKFFVVDSLMALYVNSKNLSTLASANAINSSIAPQNVIESNQVEFNTIMQSFLLNDSAAMMGYLGDLRELAKKCPLTDGNVVYQARALLSRYDTVVYFNECERGSEGPLTDTSLPGNAVHVYPNPASSEIFVKVDGAGMKVEIYSLLGVKVSSFILADGENKLDVSSLAGGTYFFKISGQAGVVKVEKVVLVKE